MNIFAQASNVSSYMIGLWRASAKNLLYHFKCILTGMVPFSPSYELGKDEVSGLDDAALKYIERMKALTQARSDSPTSPCDQNRANVTAPVQELASLREVDLDNTQAKPLSWICELFLD